MLTAHLPTSLLGLKSSFCFSQIISSIQYSLTWKSVHRNGFKRSYFLWRSLCSYSQRKLSFNAGVHFVLIVEAKAHLLFLYTAVTHISHHKFYYIFYSIIYIFYSIHLILACLWLISTIGIDDLLIDDWELRG